MTMFYNGFNLLIDIIIGGIAYYIGFKSGIGFAARSIRNSLTKMVEALDRQEQQNKDDEFMQEMQAEWLFEQQREAKHEAN